jgi:hypothetical protein
MLPKTVYDWIVMLSKYPATTEIVGVYNLETGRKLSGVPNGLMEEKLYPKLRTVPKLVITTLKPKDHPHAE